VVVVTPGGTGTFTNGYTYDNAPTVTGISPVAGPIAAGSPVTMTGTNFTGATAVTIGGAAATGITVVNSTTITASAPAGSLGTANVVVTAPGGSGTLSAGYLYEAAPTVSSIASNGGPIAGGQNITITGANFTAASAVTIGGVAVTNLSVVSSTSITATTPAGTAGAANVVVTTPSGSGTLSNGYTYYNIPTVTAISPNGGPIGGGASEPLLERISPGRLE